VKLLPQPVTAKLLATLLTSSLISYSVTALAAKSESIPFNTDQWQFLAKENKVAKHLGKSSLMLTDGVAVLKNIPFTDGIIEYKTALEPKPGFSGVFWRMQDADNFEAFYIRPHQSGKPDANQYTPAYNGIFAWQMYFGEGYSATTEYSFKEWTAVKVVVSGNNAEIYVNNMEKPALFVNLNREQQAGGLALWSFGTQYFADFHVTPMATPPLLKGKPTKPADMPAGTIPSWSVSNAFDSKLFADKIQLSPADKQDLTWKTLAAESPNGTANLAKIQGISKGKDTVFARTTIHADKAGVNKLEFGFSDKVQVYLNDQLWFAGNDLELSRDYRFLGSVGYFDAVYLPLKEGDNELWLAITEENIGGWAVQARFVNSTGISFR